MTFSMLTALVTFTWSTFETANSPRGILGHTMNIVDSYLYVFGGYNGETFHNELHVLDLNSIKYTSVTWKRDPYFKRPESASLTPCERSDHTMVCGYQSDLYLFVSMPRP